MTQVSAGLETGQSAQSQPPGRNGTPEGRAGYVALLRRPGAVRFWLTAMIGRAPMAMFGLGTVLLVSARTGSYGLAGLVAGSGSIGYAISAPQVARLADRFGQHRVLRPLAAFFGLACLTFVTCAELRAPIGVLMVTGCLAGSSMPSLGSMVRARWSALLGDPAALHAAFALESVTDEMIFVFGPAVVTLIATAVPPSGVLTCMVIGVTGTLLFAAQRQTEPPVRPRRGQTTLARAKHVPARGLLTMAPVYLFVGAMFASIDLSTVDFAQRAGHKSLAGLILATYAFGSGLGGLWYGSRTWQAPLQRRFALTLALTVAGVATFWAQPDLLSLDAGVLVAGLTISPTLIAGYGVIERQASPARRTEAMTWLSSTISVGVAMGSSACGRIIDAAGPRWGYAFAASLGLIAVTICLLGLGRLSATPEAEAAQCVNAQS
jgi:predicted MFS family arabinose efflux permease